MEAPLGIVPPYIVAYRSVPDSDHVGIIHVLHGSRHFTRKLLHAVDRLMSILDRLGPDVEVTIRIQPRRHATSATGIRATVQVDSALAAEGQIHAFLGFYSELCYIRGMINLSQETEALAKRLAAAQRLPVEAVLRQALEAHARGSGIEQEISPRRRMTVEQMLAFGSEIAAMPLLDPRSPNEIMDDINEL